MNVTRMILTGILGLGLMSQSITHCLDPKYTNLLKWGAVAASATTAFIFSSNASKAMVSHWERLKQINRLQSIDNRFNAVKTDIEKLSSDSTREQINALKQGMDKLSVDKGYLDYLLTGWHFVMLSYKINPYDVPAVGIFSSIETMNEEESKAEKIKQIDKFKQYAKRLSNFLKLDLAQLTKEKDEARSTAQWNGICSIAASVCGYGLYRYLKPSY